MALDNRATPKYYGKFRDAVMRGEIAVNAEVSMEMNRIDANIANPAFYYDEDAIEGWIAFCETELTLTDGSDLFLLDSFKLWGESLLSWFYFVERSVWVPGENGEKGSFEKRVVKKRLISKQYLIVGRGAAKSLYLSSIQGKYIAVDPSSTHQITTAPTMRQADEVMSSLRTAITRARGPWLQFMTEGSVFNTTGSKHNRVKLASTKKGIENFMSSSLLEVRPMSIDKLQGLRPKVSTIDEWLSGDIREDVMGAIEQGASKLDDYIIIAASSEGTVRNSIGDTIKMELSKILKGEYKDPHTSIWWYKLDSIDEVGNPEAWIKANPNLGKTVTFEAYQRDVERAENNPAVRNDVLAKRFGLPMEGLTYSFTYDEIQLHRPQTFWNLPCALGADMSQGDDFCSFLFLFPLGGERFGIKTINFISEHTLMSLAPALRVKYETFLQEGTLFVLDGTILNMLVVYEYVDQYIIENQLDVRAFGYDPYNAKEFVERWIQENGEYGVDKVIQGARTESVPLGEIKKLAEQRLLLFDQNIMNYTMGNAITLEDTNGNRKLWRKRSDQKVDCVAALIDAFVAYKKNLEEFE